MLTLSLSLSFSGRAGKLHKFFRKFFMWKMLVGKCGNVAQNRRSRGAQHSGKGGRREEGRE